MNCSETCPVSRIERLMLVTDASVFSEGAIREALSFARKCSSKLYAISVIETNPEYETIGSDVFDKEEGEIQEHLESIKAKALDQGLRCETIFHHWAEPHKVIVEEAAERHIDMIIIGRRGRKGLAKLLLGEVAAKVIGHAPCKVLVVPKAAQIGYRNILVATDGSKHSEAAANEAVNIAKHCGSSIMAVSVCPSEDEMEEAKEHVHKVAEMARQNNIPVETLTPMGRPYDVIAEIAGGRGVDLIVMGAYGKTGLKKLLMGSSTEKVIGLAGCAVLVVN
jgi:nucleotide-binding universal stress UspA family protein